MLPVVLAAGSHTHHHGGGGVWATVIHTLGYFTVAAAAALLRGSWFNLDLIWAIALMVTGVAALT